VVMSACESGVPGIDLPDEVVSLTSGLLQAGAHSVVSTLWLVGDAPAAMVMIRFYHLWRKQGIAPLRALVLAQRWVRDSTNGEKHKFFADEGARKLAACVRDDD